MSILPWPDFVSSCRLNFDSKALKRRESQVTGAAVLLLRDGTGVNTGKLDRAGTYETRKHFLCQQQGPQADRLEGARPRLRARRMAFPAFNRHIEAEAFDQNSLGKKWSGVRAATV